jgi:hypothetical protein
VQSVETDKVKKPGAKQRLDLDNLQPTAEATMNERELSSNHQQERERPFELKNILATGHLLGQQRLVLDEASLPWILNHIDCFVSRSRGNKIIKEVFLYPYSVNGMDYEVWDKVGLAVGNLHGIKTL